MVGIRDSSFHETLHRDEVVRGSSDRAFGLVFAVLFAVIGAFKLWHDSVLGWWWLGASGAVAAVALTVPGLLAPANRVWLKFGLLLHRVVEPLVMGILFFAVVTPIGAAMRLAGKDPLRLKREPAAATYWLEREPPGPQPDSIRNQF